MFFNETASASIFLTRIIIASASAAKHHSTTTISSLTRSHRAAFASTVAVPNTQAVKLGGAESTGSGSASRHSGSPSRAGRWFLPTVTVAYTVGGAAVDHGEEHSLRIPVTHRECPVNDSQNYAGNKTRTVENVKANGGGGIGSPTRGHYGGLPNAAAMHPVTTSTTTTNTQSTSGDTVTDLSLEDSNDGLLGFTGFRVVPTGATRGVDSASIVDTNAESAIDRSGTTPGFVNIDPYTIWNPEEAYTVRGICLVIFGTMGVLLNVFMIIAIVPNRRLRTVRNILLVHLGVVGLASSVTLTLTAAIVIFHGVWLGGRVVCHAYGFTLSVFTFVSVWTITALSWDKYRTIASPLHHSLTASFSKMTACFILFWFSAVSLSTPPLFGANKFVFDKDMAICMIDFSKVHGMSYTLIYISLAFVIPFLLITYCYLHIFRIARNQSSRIAATMVRMVSVIQAPISSAPQTALSIKGTKAIYTILQLMGAFTLTYLPFSVVLLLRMSFDIPLERVAVVFVTTIFQAAPLTNAAVYGVRNKILRASFYRYTRRKVQDFCYRDRRRGSVRSVTKRSTSALRLSLLHKRCITSAVVLPNEFGGQVSNPIHGLRRTQSYPTKTLPEFNGVTMGLSRTISGPYQHSLINLNEVKSLTPVD